MESFQNITFKLNDCEITLSAAEDSEVLNILNGEIIPLFCQLFHCLTFLDDEGAVEYLKELVNNGEIDLAAELQTVYRKENDGYLHIYHIPL